MKRIDVNHKTKRSSIREKVQRQKTERNRQKNVTNDQNKQLAYLNVSSRVHSGDRIGRGRSKRERSHVG